MIRTFIAVELLPQIKEELSNLVERMNTPQINKLRWVPVGNIHLTLKFIGEIEEQMLPNICLKLSELVGGYNAFEMQIGGVGTFPGINNPRVIWVGCQFPEEGFRLQNDVEDCLVPFGVEKESRRFHPHLTLARVSKYASSGDYKEISAVIHKWRATKTWKMRVDQLKLFRSDLKPGGAQYSVLSKASLIS